MIPQEFKIQIFKTKNQWENGGIFYRLDAQEDGGITLRSSPSFSQWIIQQGNGINNPGGLAVDECCQVYFMEYDEKSGLCGLYRYDYGSQNLELLSYISGSESEISKCPARMILDKHTLWVNDPTNHRVLAFSRENYQIKFAVNKYFIGDGEELIDPIDIGLDSNGDLFVLDMKSNKIRIVKYDTGGNFIKPAFELDLEKPVGFAFGGMNDLWVIDGKKKKLLRFKEKDSKFILYFASDLSSISEDFKPSYIARDRKANIFISDSKGLVHQFDFDGSYIGIVLGFVGQVNGLTTDSQCNLYIMSDKGICKLSAQETFTKETGIYYSKTLDSGITGCQWHRIALETEIPDRTLLEVSYSLSDNAFLKEMIDNKISEDISTQEKARFIDGKLEWSKPEKNPGDMLFREKNGRYLWLKLRLLTFDEKAGPSVTRMKILYPRISYLRYLPAIYQENPTSREFLERFLSIFETAFYDLEMKISHIYRYFDPDTVPQHFLNWLASLLNVALEEEWPEHKKRRFIREASGLYRSRGTPAGMEKIIEIYTDKKPIIQEHSKIGKPMVLNGALKLGINSFLIQTPVRGFNLGDDSILGRVALLDQEQSSGDPFLPLAYRFTVSLDLSAHEAVLYEKGLRRIIDENKPAHTAYNLRFVSNIGAYAGMNTGMDLRPIRLGITAAIGSGIITGRGEKGGRVEQNVRVGQDTRLI